MNTVKAEYDADANQALAQDLNQFTFNHMAKNKDIGWARRMVHFQEELRQKTNHFQHAADKYFSNWAASVRDGVRQLEEQGFVDETGFKVEGYEKEAEQAQEDATQDSEEVQGAQDAGNSWNNEESQDLAAAAAEFGGITANDRAPWLETGNKLMVVVQRNHDAERIADGYLKLTHATNSDRRRTAIKVNNIITETAYNTRKAKSKESILGLSYLTKQVSPRPTNLQ